MPDDCTLQVKHAVCLELKKKDKVCCNWWLIYYLLSKYHNGMAKISLQASFMVWCSVTSKPKELSRLISWKKDVHCTSQHIWSYNPANHRST